MSIPPRPTTYILAGNYHVAVNECLQHGIHPWNIPLKDRRKDLICYVPTSQYVLEGRNIKPGDSVLFGYGTTVDMIDAFVSQAASRGTKLSDLRIIHK